MLDLGGTYRAVTPEQTLAKIEPMMWPVFGITRCANVTGLDNIEIPTYVTVRPYSKLLTTSQGKGINHALAKVSAIMESIEGWHAENLAPPDLVGSYEELSAKYPLTPIAESFNAGPLIWSEIEKMVIPWVKGTEINSNQDIYFPYTLVKVDMSVTRQGYRYLPPSSNGLASGNTYEEAVCHALFEVIERECESAADDFEVSFPRVDFSTIKAPHLLELLAHIDERQLKLNVWDITNEMGVPTYHAQISDKEDLRSVGVQVGSGTHFSSVVALSRAITEAIQARATMISGARDDMYPSSYSRKEAYSVVDRVEEVKESQFKAFVEITAPKTFEETLEKLLMVLKAHGHEQVLVYDHTKKEIDIPVVHVVVPGLHFNMLRHSNDG